MRELKIFIFVLGFLFLSVIAFADTIHLKDGRSYKGQFIRGDPNGVVFKTNGKTMGFPIHLISSLSFGEGQRGEGTGEKGKGILRGMVVYSQKLDSPQGPESKPDGGARVYACKLKLHNLDVFKNYEEALHSGDVPDFVKDYLKYRWAKWNQKFLSNKHPKPESDPWERELKKLGADTEKGWMEVRSRGQKVFSKLESGEIPSGMAISGSDGTFSMRLPVGYYFLIARSKRSMLEDAYGAVKISDGETTQVSFKMNFLD